MTHTNLETTGTGLEVAVIGMAGMFPGAKNIQRFWDNLKNGKESISYFTESQLKETGVEPEELADPGYVKARAILEDIEEFDSSFFNISPPEAEVMDPQMRLFHRCSWEALEDAAYNPDTYDGLIGVYAGATSGSYWQVLMQLSGKTERLGSFAAALLTDKDNLCTRISYSLNLKGPALFVKSACSTSLVSIHYGIQGLLSGECDIALAGGVSIHLPQETGYRYQPGMVMSPDGHCRAFDSRAGGTVPGSGAGVVVLKRFDEAVADRDHIYAVVRGSAVNNDGAMKVGYTAPGVAGQAAVITAALQMAGVKPETVSYIETHGTATELGDPIEVEALKRAFNTPKKSFCALGSVKSNIGHLDSAAGVAGFIKTVLALKHKTLPPSLHFHTPNPNIDFIDSPFYINTEQVPWEHENSPLRAGVSSFGIGGTNAHIVLEEAPPRKSGDTNRNQNQVILLSARTAAALERMQKKLAVYIKQNPAVSLDDIAYSLQVGRKTFEYRSMHVVTGREEAIETLEADAPANRYTNAPGDTPPTTPGTAGIPHNPHHADAATQHQTRDRLLMETAVQWLYGKKTDWADYYSGEERNRAALPTYSFEPRRYPLNVPTIQKLLKSRHPDTWQSLTIPGSAPAAGTETEPESGESTAHREPRPPLDNEYAPPANALEEKIATLWQEFLGIEPIGIHDDFLQLGGDSLKAITLISRVQKEAKITVPLVEFFKRPTIAHLAGHTQKAPAAPYRALQAAEKREYYPLSAAQKGVYAQQQIDKTNTAYNVPQAFVIKPGLDKKTISKTLRRLIERHEGLRTSFIQEGGEPAMRIHNPGTILSEIEILDAGESQLEDGAIEKTVYGFIRPFELSRVLFMRTGVIQM
ncbi:MAG: hypothetical protein GY757_28275 [bacterium]|nr:hypothetical protein [bacterium]